MPETLLSVQSATKRFGDVVALDSVDLDIHQGDIVGLVGSNGAGKTTLLRLLSGVYRPTTGRVVLGDDSDVVNARNRLGVVPENTGLYARLTAWENIRYHARIHGVSDDEAWNRTSYFAKHLDMHSGQFKVRKVKSSGAHEIQTSQSVFVRVEVDEEAPPLGDLLAFQRDAEPPGCSLH